jgi:hypothetical protein
LPLGWVREYESAVCKVQKEIPVYSSVRVKGFVFLQLAPGGIVAIEGEKPPSQPR